MSDLASMMSEERRLRQLARKHPQYRANTRLILSTRSFCYLCKKPVDVSLRLDNPNARQNQYSDWYPEIDHIIPIVRGGHGYDIANLDLVHRTCNRIKGIKLLSEIQFDAFEVVKRSYDGLLVPSKKNRLAMMEE